MNHHEKSSLLKWHLHVSTILVMLYQRKIISSLIHTKNGKYSQNIPIGVRCFIYSVLLIILSRIFPICLDSLLFVYCLQRGHHQPCKVSYPPKDLSLNTHGNACKICTLKPHDLTNVLLLLMGTVHSYKISWIIRVLIMNRAVIDSFSILFDSLVDYFLHRQAQKRESLHHVSSWSTDGFLLRL